MKWFMTEDNGKLSSTRLAFLLWSLGVLAIWMYSSLTKGEMQAIDQSVVTILGLLMGGKAVQRFGENSPAASPPNSPTTGS